MHTLNRKRSFGIAAAGAFVAPPSVSLHEPMDLYNIGAGWAS